MGHETSQYDIQNCQLLAANSQPGVCRWTEIGEPKITYTIFGRAMVRQISEQGKNYRAWLMPALAVTAIATAAWLGWIEPQLGEQLQGAAPPPPPSARVRITAPAYQPEFTPLPAITTPELSKPTMPVQSEINNPVASRQQPSGLKPTMQMATNPIAVQPLKASNPQAVSSATNNNSSMNQTGLQQLQKLSAPVKPVAPTAAIHPAKQSESISPVAVTRVDPLTKEAAPPPSPAGNNQPPDAANNQQ